MEDSQAHTIKKIKSSLLIAGFLLVVVFAFFIYRNLTFHIVNTNPSTNKITVITPFLKINFNKTLSNRISVSAMPATITDYKIQGKQINISLAIPLQPDQSYKIDVSNIYDTAGHHIANQEFVFQPQEVGSQALPEDQNKALKNQEAQYSQSIENNKLLQLLPFVGPNFEYRIDYNVNYGSNGNKVTVEITAPDTASQQDALAWIKSQGSDPSKLKIQYVTAQP